MAPDPTAPAGSSQMDELKAVLASLRLEPSASSPQQTHSAKLKRESPGESHWVDRHPYKWPSASQRPSPLKGSSRGPGPAVCAPPAALAAARPLSDWVGPDELRVLPLRAPGRSRAAASCAVQAGLDDLLQTIDACRLSQMSHMALSMYS